MKVADTKILQDFRAILFSRSLTMHVILVDKYYNGNAVQWEH
jgi:hypothetical protein